MLYQTKWHVGENVQIAVIFHSCCIRLYIWRTLDNISPHLSYWKEGLPLFLAVKIVVSALTYTYLYCLSRQTDTDCVVEIKT